MRITLVSENKSTSVSVSDYWDRTVHGFGVYTKEIGKAVQKNLNGEYWQISGHPDLKVSMITLGSTTFLKIEKETKGN